MNLKLVSHDTAVMLKSIGFNWLVDCFFNSKNTPKYSPFPVNANKEIDKISQPSLALAAQWLRGEKRLHVNVYFDNGAWWVNVTKLDIMDCVYNDPFDTHDIALAAGIKRACELLKRNP